MKYSVGTVGHFINLLSRDFANRNAITYYSKYRVYKYTFKEINELVEKLSVYFYENGIKKGDKILVYAGNCPEWGTILLSAGLTGIIIVPVDFNSNLELVNKIASLTKPKLIITDKVETCSGMDMPVYNIDNLFERIKNCGADSLNSYNYYISGDDIFEIVYTSGTTSEPKGVVIKQKNIVSNIRSLRMRLRCNPSWKFFSMLPLSHLLEQTVGFFSPLRFGCEVVFYKFKKFSDIGKIIKSHGITCIVAVPSILSLFKEKIVDTAKQRGMVNKLENLLNFSGKFPMGIRRLMTYKIRKGIGRNLDMFISGGGQLSRDVEDFWENLGIRVVQGYGLTEASPIVTCNSFNMRVRGSVGKVLKLQNIKIDNDGEIRICGENITAGYYQRPDLDKEYFENGWYKTGDIGHLDDAANLFLTGRKKNMIVGSSGLNVYPEDIEAVINKDTNVADSVVFADDQNGNIQIVAAIIPAADSIDIEEIKSKTNKSLEIYQQINKILLWPNDSFPMTPTLKINRKDVVEQYHSFKHSDSPNKRVIGETVSDKIVLIINSILNTSHQDIKTNTQLVKDLGFDSLKIIELVVALENTFHNEIDETTFSNNLTFGDVVKCIETPSQALKKLGDDTKRAFSPFIHFGRKIIIPFVRTLVFNWILGIKVTTKGNLQLNKNEPVIFIANHQSHLDTTSILFSLKSPVRYKTVVAAADDYFFQNRGFAGYLFSFLFNLFPFYRKDNFRMNFENVGRFIDKGISVLIYPEGTRSRDGKMASFKPGIGIIVKEMNVPVIPIGLKNTFTLLPFNSKFPKRGNIEAKFGDKIEFNGKTPEEIARELETAVRELCS